MLCLSSGCQTKTYHAYDDATLTSQQVLYLLTHDRGNQVSSLFGGSGSHIHDSGSGFGGNRVQVYDTPSRVAEYHLIEDRYDAMHLRRDPLLLIPMLRMRDPNAALTAIHVYEKAFSKKKKDYSERPYLDTDVYVIRPEDRPRIAVAIQQAVSKHPDLRVRLHSAWFLINRGYYTPEDLETWLSDNSDEVRLAVAFCLQGDEYPKRMEDHDELVPPHERARLVAELASVIIAHVDDTNIHTASSLMYGLTRLLGHYGKFEALQEPDAPGTELLRSKWIYLSWQERRDRKQDMQAWWDRKGKQAYIQAVTASLKEKAKQAAGVSD